MRSGIISIKHLMWITIIVSCVIGFYFFDRLNLNWMCGLYALGSLIIGVLIFRGDVEASFLTKKKSLGASYWGVYQGTALEDEAKDCTIKPPKPCKDINGLAGSGAYANGTAVKSAR